MGNTQRVGDSSTHGGETITGSPTTHADGISVARIGDLFLCPIHGLQSHVGGSPTTHADTIPICRVGDAISCGASCTGASPTTTV